MRKIKNDSPTQRFNDSTKMRFSISDLCRCVAVSLCLSFPLFAQTQSLTDAVRELEGAKELYNDKMAELEKVSSDRWKDRQKDVLEKEQNSDQLQQRQSEVEQLYSDVARVREEKLAREELVGSEESKLKEAQANWKALISVIEQKRKLADDQSGGVFPIGFEQRMAAVSAVENQFPGDRYPAEAFKGIVATQADQLRDSKAIVSEKTVITDDHNNPIEVNLLRIGHAYAIARADSSAYYLSFFGENASQPFKWEKISDPTTAQTAGTAIGAFADGKPAIIPFDMLQNDQSQELISGKRVPFFKKLVDTLSKGGMVMIPLLAVALWALLIILNRIVVFAIYHRRDHSFIKKAIILLETGNIPEAKKLAETGNCVLAKVLNSCLKHSDQSRVAAEQSVKELLLGELPSLEKHLDTLAVIAGAAPLLGLLGTVSGMIAMFGAVTQFGTGDPKLLAGGISEALIATEAGLFIAIPALLLHNWLRNKRNAVQNEMEIYAVRILNRIWPAE